MEISHSCFGHSMNYQFIFPFGLFYFNLLQSKLSLNAYKCAIPHFGAISSVFKPQGPLSQYRPRRSQYFSAIWLVIRRRAHRTHFGFGFWFWFWLKEENICYDSHIKDHHQLWYGVCHYVIFNSLWLVKLPDNTYLAPEMTGCLMAPSHHLKHCWLIVSSCHI